MKKRNICIVCIFILTLMVVPVFGANFYVRAGSDGAGTKSDPYGKIADALGEANAGDVIHVTEGVYYGDGDSGLWLIKVPNITIVGGYDKKFSKRHPFKYRTLLLRGLKKSNSYRECDKRNHKKWHSMKITKASYNGNAMVYGMGDNSGFILDGFFLDGHTRNTYKRNGDLHTGIGPVGSPLISMNKPGVKIRNCVVFNSAGRGIRLIASGLKKKPETWAEVSNCIIVNTLMSAIDFRVGTYDPKISKNSGYAIVKNNTIAFVWTLSGEGYGLLVGRQTKIRAKNNLFSFSSMVAINNGFGNKYLRLIDNNFWNNIGGVYKYWSPRSKLILIHDKPAKYTGKGAKKYALSRRSKGNVEKDPSLVNIDKAFFEKFSNQIKSKGGGKVKWNSVNRWRSAMGLPLIGSKGSGKQNYAPIYEIENVLLFPKASKKYGAQFEGPFKSYYSKTVVLNKNYKEVKFLALVTSSALHKKDVKLKLKIKSKGYSDYYLKTLAPRGKYIVFKVGGYPKNTFLYVKRGSKALRSILEAYKARSEVEIKGTAYSIKALYKKDKVAVIVDDAKFDDDDD